MPRGAFPELASAFDESIDWVAGNAPPRWELDAAPVVSEEARAVAVSYENMSPIERQRLRLLMLAALDGVEPNIPDVPNKKRHPRSISILGGLEDLAPVVPIKTPKKKEGDPR